MISDLFDQLPEESEDRVGPRPLADKLRPQSLGDVVGQDHLLRNVGPIGSALTSGKLGSIILWGPPGVGKTTIARLLADATLLAFVQVSAIFTGVAELKKVFETARIRHQNGRPTLLFVDEIHRFNKTQQDGFLPHMESGAIVLVGATTENPSFELNAALLSRAQVLQLRPLDRSALEMILVRAEAEVGDLQLKTDARDSLIDMADGDGRSLLNLVEQLLNHGQDVLDRAGLAARLNRRAPVYDKSGDGHYNLISALHKSVRGSDPDAALYWLARMLEAGEDPRYIARRVTRMAVEDIGLAEPDAVAMCLSCWETFERLGSPEGELAIAQAVIHLALAPKSNASYVAYKQARKAAKETGSLAPPNHILNAPTTLMKELGYGAGYAYDHDAEDGFSGQDYFPEAVGRLAFYKPLERGFERELSKRLVYFGRLREKKGEA